MTDACAVITGITGQDGWYLSQILLDQGYRLFGTTRSMRDALTRVDPRVELVQWDMTDEAALTSLLRTARPREIYNLAAYASGAGMYDDPVGIGDINGLAVARILEAIRATDPSIRVCQASSSEVFGEPLESPQSENTPLRPRSPYGAAKLYAHELIGIYRRRYGMHACSAILFNHESPRRGPEFVTGKVARAVARIKRGLQDELVLGNLDAQRDWGFSADYMQGLWLMLQAETADDYILATGKAHSVRMLCALAFQRVALDYRRYVREDTASFRPAESFPLVGNATKANRQLLWSPQIDFQALVDMMVDAELNQIDTTTNERR